MVRCADPGAAAASQRISRQNQRCRALWLSIRMRAGDNCPRLLRHCTGAYRMGRDPLYRDILERLEGDLDEGAFQRCAQDLLRDTYPALVPMAAVDDAGMDGAIGTADGPFP